LGEGADHQAVPRRQDLVVEPRPDAFLARLEQPLAGRGQPLARLVGVDAEPVRERLDLERRVQDVRPLEVAPSVTS
jgi:hypothetical protein